MQTKIQRPDQRLQLQLRMRIAHQNHFGRGLNAHQPAERSQGFSDPFVGLQETKDADQRRGLVQPQTLAEIQSVGVRNPGAMRDASHGSRESRVTQFRFHAAAVHDGRFGPAQQLAQHRDAFVVRPHFQPPHTVRIRHVPWAAFLLHGSHIGVPIATLNSDVRDQMMQIGFVHHNHAGMIHRGLITKVVINVVAHLVQRDIEILGVERNRFGCEHLHIHQLLQFVEKRGGIVGNAAARRRKRREERYLDCHEWGYFANSIENVPNARGTRTNARVRALSCRKKTSKLMVDDGPEADTLR